ncbi:MAG: CDP-diacylglycerol--serine O-phosphatidyltransferase [uncultured Thermomicrobiales bacterium]|uniref:CDP-diacylglycerol--serine O-phosphatidyltransferase n=1 Tax=uncultured Thermomicrobiales bacterium TaxID=1645740 RepID=A0A6J4U869_9BACT|nr:MAG: CDP-diacylglycerol--serine O-phosphatidyltransferase [uncultured Thermomicrobiales bacterium]
MTFRQSLPMAVTMLTLACGLAALEAARTGAWDASLRLILLAAIADGVDGPLARWLGATSAMGEQLDSLADMVAFGIAPAFLFSAYYDRVPDAVRFGGALVFVLAGAYRLARYHAQPTDGAFCGLPITVAGPLLTATVAGPFGAGAREAGAVGIGLAALMACHHPFPPFAQPRRWLLPAIAAASLPVALWPRGETLAVVVALTFGLYVVWGLVGRVVNDDVPRIDGEVREVVGPRP